ncbi:MAG: DUF4010 domain-containing protein [Luteimonas sp.]
MFRFSHALGFAVLVSALMLLSAALAAWVGPQGAMLAAIASASAELHAAVATLGMLAVRGDIDTQQARWLMLGLLAASLSAKSVIAWVSGGLDSTSSVALLFVVHIEFDGDCIRIISVRPAEPVEEALYAR